MSRLLASAFLLACLIFQPGQAAAAGPPGLDTVRGQCRSADGAVLHESSETWFYALVPAETSPAATDQYVEADVRIEASGAVEPPSMTARQFEFPGENDPAYDAGLLLRYTGDGPGADYYRVQLSAAPDGGEVTLWRPSGGYLAVKPYPFHEKTTYHVRAEASGAWVRVQVNNEPVLEYADPRPPQGGRPGVAALRGLVRLSEIRHGAITLSAQTMRPPHAPDFHLRKWNNAHPGDWIFDHDEPVALLNPGPPARLEMAKLRPGVAPSVAYSAFAAGPEDPVRSLRIPVSIDHLSQGTSYGVLIGLRDQAGSGAKAAYRMVLHYDQAADAYRYKYSLTVEAPPDKPWDWGRHYNFEWFDPWPMAASGQVTQPMPAPYQRHAWVVWQSPGLPAGVRRGLMPDYYQSFPGALNSPERALLLGGVAVLAADSVVNPAVKLLDPGGLPHYLEVCDFGYDLHFRVGEDAFASGVPAGTRFEVKWVMYPETAEVSGKLVAKARELSGWHGSLWVPALGWPETDFTRLVDAAAPHNEATWRGGRLDPRGGPDGKPSVRLAPGETLRLAGNFKDFPHEYLEKVRGGLAVEAATGTGQGELTVSLDVKSPWSAHLQERLAFAGSGPTRAEAALPGLGEVHDATLALANTGPAEVVISRIAFLPSSPAQPGRSIGAVSLAGLAEPDLVRDQDARLAAAVRLGPKTFPPGRMIFGPYDLSLPPGEYMGVARVRVEGELAQTSVVCDINQTDGRVTPVPAKFRIGPFPGKRHGYRNVLFVFRRDPGGRMNLRFYDQKGPGAIVVDEVVFERLADGFGNRLQEAWAVAQAYCPKGRAEVCAWATSPPESAEGEAQAAVLPAPRSDRP